MEEGLRDHVSSTGKRFRKNSSSDSDNIPSPTKPGNAWCANKLESSLLAACSISYQVRCSVN